MNETRETVLEVRNLKKHFPISRGFLAFDRGVVKAVDDISFTIGKSEIFGLVGESGCGKSTAGRTILNLLPPTAGSVRFEDTVIFDVENRQKLKTDEMRAMRRNMQIIFQDPFASLDPRKSVGYIVSEGIKKHKLCKPREAIDKAKYFLELCGLPASSVNKYPHEFSGGQRQRIGIARSLSIDPKFIIGDEPLAALDVSIQVQILTLLQKLIEDLHLTTLFISHDLGVIQFFCDRIAVMYLGAFVEMGTNESIFKNQLHPYTKALFSAVPKSMPGQKKEQIILQGEIPSAANPPPGCRFHTRCPFVMPRCNEARPELKEVETDYYVACHLYD